MEIFCSFLVFLQIKFHLKVSLEHKFFNWFFNIKIYFLNRKFSLFIIFFWILYLASINLLTASVLHSLLLIFRSSKNSYIFLYFLVSFSFTFYSFSYNALCSIYFLMYHLKCSQIFATSDKRTILSANLDTLFFFAYYNSFLAIQRFDKVNKRPFLTYSLINFSSFPSSFFIFIAASCFFHRLYLTYCSLFNPFPVQNIKHFIPPYY